MTQKVIWVSALCTNDQRLVNTVVAHRKSTRFHFNTTDGASGPAPDIVVVDSHAPRMRNALADALERNPRLSIVWLVLTGTQTRRAEREFELPYVQIVSHLIGVLEQAAAGSIVHTPAPAPGGTVLQLVPERRSERVRALVVDDSPTVRLQLRQTVERIGLGCDCAGDGQSALALLKEQSYGIVYVDVVMPDMDGYRLTREIRRQPRHAGVPVVILTGQSSPFDRARGALAGCDSFLTKPVELKRFFDVTARNLRKNLAIGDLGDWLVDPTQPARAATTPEPPDQLEDARRRKG
jgi:twitching motility two-component system response regulator PilG